MLTEVPLDWLTYICTTAASMCYTNWNGGLYNISSSQKLNDKNYWWPDKNVDILFSQRKNKVNQECNSSMYIKTVIITYLYLSKTYINIWTFENYTDRPENVLNLQMVLNTIQQIETDTLMTVDDTKHKYHTVVLDKGNELG